MGGWPEWGCIDLVADVSTSNAGVTSAAASMASEI